jgi:hypothetical protein
MTRHPDTSTGTPAEPSALRCYRCGATGENFDWQGYCLMCEDDDGNDCVQLDQYEDCEL